MGTRPPPGCICFQHKNKSYHARRGLFFRAETVNIGNNHSLHLKQLCFNINRFWNYLNQIALLNSSGSLWAGVPLFPNSTGGVCAKAGVADTIRVAAKHQAQPQVDPGGLFLHTEHNMRATDSQALSRSSLPEHTVALVAMWARRRCCYTSGKHRLPRHTC